MANCLFCSVEIAPKSTGRLPLYCSNAHKVAAFRFRNRNETPALGSVEPNQARLCNETACNETACNETTCNETACNETTCNETTCNETACNETTCNETACNEKPALGQDRYEMLLARFGTDVNGIRTLLNGNILDDLGFHCNEHILDGRRVFISCRNRTCNSFSLCNSRVGSVRQ